MKTSPLYCLRLMLGLLLFACLSTGTTPLHAQLVIQLETLALPDITIDATNFPHVSARVRANLDGSRYALSTDELLIQEDNRTVRPHTISAPNGAGYQTMEWITTLRGVQRDGSSTPENPVGLNPATVYGIVNGQVAQARAMQRRFDPPLLRFLGFNPELTGVLPDVNFGKVAPGQDSTVFVYVQLQTAARENGQEQPIQVDSVTISSDQFSWEWKGAAVNPSSRFPINVQSPFRYLIEVTFRPTSNDFAYDTLSVHYADGATRQVFLIGNQFEVPDVSPLRLLAPADGSIFAPCEEVLIEWEGATPDLPVEIEFSADAGRNWELIGQTTDEEFLWRLPSEGSEQVRFRVTQPLQSTETRTLQESGPAVGSVGFSADSRSLLSADQTGAITSWDVASGNDGQIYTIPGARFNVQAYRARTLRHISEEQFVAVYTNFISQRDSIFIFDIGQEDPAGSLGLPASFPLNAVAIDPNGRFVLCGSLRSAELLIVDIPSFNTRRIAFDAPITGVTISGSQEKAVISLLDGQLEILDIPAFTPVNTIDLSHLQIINQIEMSPDGRFVAIATQSPRVTQQGGGRASVHIIDVNSGATIRSFRRSSTDAVGFSFSSTARFLAIGFEGAPQTRIYNLPNDRDEGSIISHPAQLSDLQFADDGFSIASSSLGNIQNLKLRTFSFPERDSNDTFIRIVPPTVRLANANFPPALIGASEPVSITNAICNDGETPLDLENIFLGTGLSFRLAQAFTRDTLQPGECRDVDLIFNPSDTGSIRDVLVFASCEREFTIPLQAQSLNRNIALLANNYDFGELCVGEELTVELELIRNDDNRPLLVNSIFIEDIATSPFVLAEAISDTVLQPGEVLRANVRFSPLDLGSEQRVVTIEHSDQRSVTATFDFRGFGVGAELAYSHQTLTFIPEIRNRVVSISNNSDNPVIVNDVQSADPAEFQVNTAFPTTIGPGETLEIAIEYLGEPGSIPTSELLISSEPCSGNKAIILGAYRATSIVTLPTVEADPTEPTSIPISFRTDETVAYDGSRTFEAVFSLNQRLFLPQTVESNFGEAEIWRNEVIGELRYVGIRVTGNFTAEGVVVNLNGLPGLSETLRTPIEFVPDESLYWSAAISTLGEAGELIITPQDPTRRLIKRQALMTVRGVFPNPAAASTVLEVRSQEALNVRLEVVDMLGNRVSELPPLQLPAGNSEHTLDLSAVPVGAYRIILVAPAQMTSTSLLIAR